MWIIQVDKFKTYGACDVLSLNTDKWLIWRSIFIHILAKVPLKFHTG